LVFAGGASVKLRVRRVVSFWLKPRSRKSQIKQEKISSYNKVYIYIEEIQVYVHEDRSGIDTNISSCSRNYNGKGRIFYAGLAF